jgi:putative DNA primase/helicase
MSQTLKELMAEIPDHEQNTPILLDDVDYLMRNFVMIHGTDCVWDRSANRMMKLTNLRHSAPQAFKIWQSNPGREWIDMDKVVFDPAGTHGDDVLNMFSGFDRKPVQGNHDPLLEHLGVLCGNDPEVVQWVLHWIAYPLQNPGAKMATAIVFQGPEGTGKNIFWDAVLDIYGKYGIAIGQSQIESEFNAWISCKLFILANEVLSNRERRHIKGRIKAMITEPTIMVNQKNMPVRNESNHANIVFLSNEYQPVDTDQSDRRFMVIEATQILSAEYYAELKSEIDIDAFYHFLINLDLGDFNPHTKPITTEAKKELLRMNARSEQRFLDEWLSGETVFPVTDAPALSLYWAYRCWCEEQGEHRPATNTAFGRSAASAKLTKERPSLQGTSKKCTVYFIGDPKSTVSEFDFEDFERELNEQRSKYHFKS